MPSSHNNRFRNTACMASSVPQSVRNRQSNQINIDLFAVSVLLQPAVDQNDETAFRLNLVGFFPLRQVFVQLPIDYTCVPMQHCKCFFSSWFCNSHSLIVQACPQRQIIFNLIITITTRVFAQVPTSNEQFLLVQSQLIYAGSLPVTQKLCTEFKTNAINHCRTTVEILCVCHLIGNMWIISMYILSILTNNY